MDEFVIRSDKEAKVTFDSRRFDQSGWLTAYAITLEARGLRATREVENLPYGSSPAKIFGELAKEWSGFKGQKEWGAIEGEFNLSASSDSIGHITLVVEILPSYALPFWSAELSIEIEAGQLERIASDAREFFNDFS